MSEKPREIDLYSYRAGERQAKADIKRTHVPRTCPRTGRERVTGCEECLECRIAAAEDEVLKNLQYDYDRATNGGE